MFKRNLVPSGRATTINDLIGILYHRGWAGQEAPLRFGKMELVSTPAEASEILSNPEIYRKEYGFLTVLGHSRFDAGGREWEVRRELTQTMYREASLKQNSHHIHDIYDDVLSRMPAGPTEQLDHYLGIAAATIFLKAVGASNDGGRAAELLTGYRRLWMVVQHLSMFGGTAKDAHAIQVRIQNIRLKIAGIVNSDAGLSDAVRAMVEEVGDQIEGFDAIGEFAVNLFAGIETTTAAASWIAMCLARMPDAREAIEQELADGAGALPRLNNFIQEVLRFFPPIPLLVRKVAANDVMLGQRILKKDQMIALSIIGLHHNPAYWSEPSTFDPDRTEFTDNSYNRRAFLPFAAGPRVCGGLGLARIELQAAAISMLKHMQFQNIGCDIDYEFAIAMRPASSSMAEIAVKKRG